MPADMPGLRITAIIAAFNEADIIQQTVGDLVRQGIAVHFIDDGSTDGTVAALEPLLASGLLRVERRPADASGRFEWARILARKEQLSRELDADWFIHHDADEFRESPWRHLNLRQGIELVDRLGYNAIDFAVLNFWPTAAGFDGRSDIREAFRHFERGAEFDRLQIRCWKKATDIDLQSGGGHDARFDRRQVFPLRFLLRHYPVRSQDHGERKVFEERRARFVEDERRRGWHVQYDRCAPGHLFTRDPATLELFDADAIRAQLQIDHRGVEARQIEIDRLERDVADLTARLERAAAALQAEEEARAAEVTAWRRLEQQHVELEQRHGALEHRFRELERGYVDLERGYADLERERAALVRDVADLARRLESMKESWSWKVTAPLRALGSQRTRA
jgi:hypothetical protein